MIFLSLMQCLEIENWGLGHRESQVELMRISPFLAAAGQHINEMWHFTLEIMMWAKEYASQQSH